MKPKDQATAITGTASGYYRITARGLLAAEDNSTREASCYLHDVLLMCRAGIWLQELRQFVPPRTLQESLQSLLSLGWIECLAPEQVPPDSLPGQMPAWQATDFSQFAA